MLLLPFLLLFGFFYLYPVIASFVISFLEYGPVRIKSVKGLNNYISLLTRDFLFQGSLKNVSLLLLTGGILPHLLALPLAGFLTSKYIHAKTRSLFKALLLIPYMISGVGLVMLYWFSAFDINTGAPTAFNRMILNFIPLNESYSVMTLLLNWKFLGWNILLYYTGMIGIPKEYYESACIEGVNAFQRLRKITIPLLSPIIFFAVSLTILYSLQLFDEPFVFNGGYQGVMHNRDALTPAYYIMYIAFGPMSIFGKASAATWILLLIILSAVGLLRMISRKQEL